MSRRPAPRALSLAWLHVRHQRSFSANLDQHIFHCFKWGRSGNTLDLWAQAKQPSIYDAAIDLCERLRIPLPTLPPPKARNREEEIVAPPSPTCKMPIT